MDAATKAFWLSYQPTAEDRRAIREFFLEEAGVAAARRRSEEDTVISRRPAAPKRCTCRAD